MKRKRKDKFTKTEAILAVKQCSSRMEFKKKYNNLYQYCLRKGILNEVCSHLPQSTKKLSFEQIRQNALTCKTRSEFAKKFSGSYHSAIKNGILDEVCSHMKKTIKWTHEKVKQEALKYNKRIEFYRNSSGAYKYAERHKILDEVCSHMEHSFTYWDYNSVKKEALKYKTRKDFARYSQPALKYAIRNGILDEICSHMEYKPKSDNDIIYIWEALSFSTENEKVYKIGVTSSRLKDLRIKEVASAGNTDYKIIAMNKVKNAFLVEKELLKYGKVKKLNKFSGSTEFRILSDNELAEILKIISKFIVV